MTDYYKCEKCGKVFDEFEMNYKAACTDKHCWCRECRSKTISDYEEAKQAIAQYLWEYRDNPPTHDLEALRRATQILNLTWPDGSPMIGVIAKDQNPRDLDPHSYEGEFKAIAMIRKSYKKAGFRRITRREK